MHRNFGAVCRAFLCTKSTQTRQICHKKTVEIRVLVESDIPFALEMYRKAGWNTPRNVFLASTALDPGGALVAVDKEGTVIGTMAASNLDENTSFLSSFYVEESHRGKGIGSQLFRKAMQHAGNRNIGLNAVLTSLKIYETIGFKIKTFSVLNYQGTKPEHSILASEKGKIVVEKFESKYRKALLDYDQHVHVIRRQKFLDKLLAPETKTVLAFNDGRIIGFGCIQPRDLDPDCYQIGPVYADDEGTAQAILAKLLEKVLFGKIISVNILSANEASVKFMDSIGFTPAFETIRMYTKSDIVLRLEAVFIMTAQEGCLV